MYLRKLIPETIAVLSSPLRWLIFGTLASGLETLSELDRIFSIYGLMLRAVGLDLEATFRCYQERRYAACNAVFAVLF